MIKTEDGKTLITGSGQEVFRDMVAINIAFLNLLERAGNAEEQANAALTQAAFQAVRHRNDGQTIRSNIETEPDKEE